jgi:hypothetical protein
MVVKDSKVNWNVKCSIFRTKSEMYKMVCFIGQY